MKYVWLALFLVATSFRAGADAAASVVKDIKEKLAMIETQMQAKGWDHPVMVEENPNTLRRIPEYRSLQENANSLWEPAISNLSDVTTSELGKAVLFHSFLELPPEQYVGFLERALILTERGQITHQQLRWSMFPARGSVRRVLIDKYNDPSVRRLLARARALFTTEPIVLSNIDSILSGKAKENLDAFLAKRPFEAVADGSKPAPATTALTTPVPMTTPATPTLTTLLEQAPALAAERRTPLWLWVLGGILALIAAVALALRCRS